jgi:hypothetical protein
MKFAFDVSFHEPRVLTSEPLRETLQKFHKLVSGTVERFKPLLT